MNTLRFFDDLPEPIQQHALKWHDWLTIDCLLQAKLRYKLPFYFQNSWICYLDYTKKARLELAFTRGNELSNSQHLLESKGRKQVYSIDITEIKTIPNREITEIVQEALWLDETIPYASKRI